MQVRLAAIGRRGSWPLRVALAAIVFAAIWLTFTSIDAYRDATTTVDKESRVVVWTYVTATIGLLVLALGLQVGAPRGRATTLTVAAAVAAAAFLLMQPDVEPHASTDGLWMFGPLVGVGIDVLIGGIVLLARFGDSSWWRDQPT